MSYAETQPIYESRLLKGLRTSPLPQLDMELTERCNNNCLHCYINLPEEDPIARDKELTLDEIKDTLAQAADLGCLTVRFTGGEPLLREAFPEIYLAARRLGMKVSLFTNGTLITDKIIHLFSRIPPLKEVEVSLYGMTQASYEGVSCVRGSFEKAFDGVKKLAAANIPFILKGALLSSHTGEQQAFERFASQFPWMKGKPALVMHYELRGRGDLKKNERIRQLRISPDLWVKHLHQYGAPLMEEARFFQNKFTVKPGDGHKLFSCQAGKNLCVDAYGGLQACMLLRDPETVYDLKKGSLKEAIDHFFPKILKKTADNPDFIERCGHCILRGMCDQCPAKSWMEHGALDTPIEYYCEIAHAEAEYLGLIEKGEKGWGGAERRGKGARKR